MLEWLRLPTVHADAAALRAVGAGLTPVPGRVPPISMRQEIVEVSLFSATAVVEATFELQSHGATTDVEVGFPRFARAGNNGFKAADASLQDFAVHADGERVVVAETRVENPTWPMWLSWKLHFPAGSTRTVHVRYWVPLVGYNGVSRLPFTYILRTGRFWDGAIGAAIVRVKARGIPLRAVCEATPGGYAVDPNAGTITWTFEILVPDADIGVLVSPSLLHAARHGLDAVDFLDLNESPPPPGTEVVVGGSLLDAKGRARYLRGERSFDGNIVIPEGVPAFSHDAASELELRLPWRIRETTIEPAPLWLHYFASWLVAGRTVPGRHGLAIEVERLYRTTPARGNRPDDGASKVFSWITADTVLRRDETTPDTTWPGGGERYASGDPSGDARMQPAVAARVPHILPWGRR